MKSKMDLLCEVTNTKEGYFEEGYEEEFYDHYEFLKEIKELLGAKALRKLYYLDNEEDVEFRALLKYLLKE